MQSCPRLFIFNPCGVGRIVQTSVRLRVSGAEVVFRQARYAEEGRRYKASATGEIFLCLLCSLLYTAGLMVKAYVSSFGFSYRFWGFAPRR